MKRVRFALALSLVWVVCAWAEEPVPFADPDLERAVEDELWTSDPTPTDMLELTSLTAHGAHIGDLGGLEYATNLRLLDLRENEIGDIGPLSGLSNLETLDLSMNRIGDISPLSGLANMTSLDVHDNLYVSDISAVGTMPKLQSLVVRHNSITSISALSGLSELSHLDLFENQIGDVSPLVGLKSLSWVDLRGNPLDEQACEEDIPQIIQDNPGLDIRYDRCGPRLVLVTSTGGGRVVSPGEGEFEYENGEIIELVAEADPCYVFVGWSGSTTGTSNPMRYLVMGDQQIRADFQSVLSELYVDDDAPGDPGPGNPQISDPLENGTPNRPFDAIQEALDVAANETTIYVNRGTYRENINLLGKKIDLVANDPCDPHAGPFATIAGTGNDPVVRISWGSGSQCSMTGFVITQGRGDSTGAISCSGASPRFTNCLIVGNRCRNYEGAALYFYESQAVLTNCTIADNYAGMEGAGLTLEDSNVTILDSILWNNRPNEIRRIGTSEPIIQYCAVRGWWPDFGNIHLDPLFTRPGCWVNPNDPNDVLAVDDARGVWRDGDYHLQSQAGRWEPRPGVWVSDDVTSPAIDAGDRLSEVGHEPSPNGDRVNMGAYGGTTEASKSFIVISP